MPHHPTPSRFPDRICEHCGTSFPVNRQVFKPGKGRFCSPQCANLARRKPSEIRVDGEVAYVSLSQGYVAVIDAADAPLVTGRAWHYTHGYAATTVYRGNGRQGYLAMHRLILDAPDDLLVDHIDHDPLNCRRSNLRLATPSQNSQNKAGARADSRTGIRGVMIARYESGTPCYRAYYSANGKRPTKHFPYTDDGLKAATEWVTEMRRQHMTHSANEDRIAYTV